MFISINFVKTFFSKILDLGPALTVKGQNIGASTKIFCKQMFDFDSIKWKFRSFGSFKNPAYTSNAIDGWEVDHQN